MDDCAVINTSVCADVFGICACAPTHVRQPPTYAIGISLIHVSLLCTTRLFAFFEKLHTAMCCRLVCCVIRTLITWEFLAYILQVGLGSRMLSLKIHEIRTFPYSAGHAGCDAVPGISSITTKSTLIAMRVTKSNGNLGLCVCACTFAACKYFVRSTHSFSRFL